MPKRGEVTTIDGFRFKVLRADSRRIYLLQITLVDEDKEAQSADIAEQNMS